MTTRLAVALACLALQIAPQAQAQTTAHDPQHQQLRQHQHGAIEQIRQLPKSYEESLNTGDAERATQLFNADGVLMAPSNAPAVGTQAIGESYRATFQAIGLDIVFQIAEVQLLARDWALLRTSSTGSIRINADGSVVPEGNQELFLLQRLGRDWKIARYSFSSSLPQ